MAFFRLFASYQRALVRRPILTNCISTGTLFATGDILAQTLFPTQPLPTQEDIHQKLEEQVPPSKAKQKSAVEQWVLTRWNNYDYMRTLRAAFYGGILFAPIGYKWYQVLAKITSPVKVASPILQKGLDSASRVAFDQLLFAPVAVPLYYSIMSILEQSSYDELKERLRQNYKVTLLTNWMVWPAFQLVNFSLVPLEFRLLTVNVISIFWNCYLSYRNSKVSSQKRLPVYNPPVPE